MKSQVGVIMGSVSDWETMKYACESLEQLEIPYEKRVVSAHRTPDLLFEYAESAREREIKVIIAGAGGAAHLPGMTAAKTIVPVIGVPIQSKALNGMDSYYPLSKCQVGFRLQRSPSVRQGRLTQDCLRHRYWVLLIRKLRKD